MAFSFQEITLTLRTILFIIIYNRIYCHKMTIFSWYVNIGNKGEFYSLKTIGFNVENNKMYSFKRIELNKNKRI